MKQQNNFIPRGTKMMLPHGGLPEVISLHLLNLIKKTGGIKGPVGKQFIANPVQEKKLSQKGNKDPLIEDLFEVAPGLIYKYRGKIKNGQVINYGRCLWTICRFCASYCRFCTRGREVGLPYNQSHHQTAITHRPYLTNNQINQVIKYLIRHKAINEVIISGGDPLACPKEYLTKIVTMLVKLQKKSSVKIIRIGSRLPIVNPKAVQSWHYEIFSKIKNPYLMVHINHPSELTKETIGVLTHFRKKSLATVMSQSVLLKGVNDSPKILHDLFLKLTEEGIRPYYLFQNDPVYWAQHFTVPFKKAIKIWGSLRPKLSGIAATCRFVIDAPFGFGKIPIPEGNAWKVNYQMFADFKQKEFIL